jgi:hypothetical protein
MAVLFNLFIFRMIKKGAEKARTFSYRYITGEPVQKTGPNGSKMTLERHRILYAKMRCSVLTRFAPGVVFC